MKFSSLFWAFYIFSPSAAPALGAFVGHDSSHEREATDTSKQELRKAVGAVNSTQSEQISKHTSAKAVDSSAAKEDGADDKNARMSKGTDVMDDDSKTFEKCQNVAAQLLKVKEITKDWQSYDGKGEIDDTQLDQDDDNAEEDNAEIEEAELDVEMQNTLKKDGLPAIQSMDSALVKSAMKASQKAKLMAQTAVDMQAKVDKVLKKVAATKRIVQQSREKANKAGEKLVAGQAKSKAVSDQAATAEKAASKAAKKAAVTATLCKRAYKKARDKAEKEVAKTVKEAKDVKAFGEEETAETAKIPKCKKDNALGAAKKAMEALAAIEEDEKLTGEKMLEAASVKETTTQPPFPDYQKEYGKQLKEEDAESEKLKQFKDLKKQEDAEKKKDIEEQASPASSAASHDDQALFDEDAEEEDGARDQAEALPGGDQIGGVTTSEAPGGAGNTKNKDFRDLAAPTDIVNQETPDMSNGQTDSD